MPERPATVRAASGVIRARRRREERSANEVTREHWRCRVLLQAWESRSGSTNGAAGSALAFGGYCWQLRGQPADGRAARRERARRSCSRAALGGCRRGWTAYTAGGGGVAVVEQQRWTTRIVKRPDCLLVQLQTNLSRQRRRQNLRQQQACGAERRHQLCFATSPRMPDRPFKASGAGVCLRSCSVQRCSSPKLSVRRRA